MNHRKKRNKTKKSAILWGIFVPVILIVLIASFVISWDDILYCSGAMLLIQFFVWDTKPEALADTALALMIAGVVWFVYKVVDAQAGDIVVKQIGCSVLWIFCGFVFLRALFAKDTNQKL